MKSVSLTVIGSSRIVAAGLKSILRGSRFRIKYEYNSLSDLWKIDQISEDSLRGIIINTSNHPPLVDSDLEHIRRWSAAIKIVLMADDCRVSDIVAVARDADGVILTSTAGTVLLKTLELVILGQRVYPAGLFQHRWAPEPVDEPDCRALVSARNDMPDIDAENGLRKTVRNLSEREVQVVDLLCNGSPNKVIARKLGISEATVKVHVKAILRKTRAQNRTEAALLFTAMRPGEGVLRRSESGQEPTRP